MKQPPENGDKSDARPDGWQRFERAVDAAVKSGPKRKATATAGVDKKARPASKGRVHKGKAKG